MNAVTSSLCFDLLILTVKQAVVVHLNMYSVRQCCCAFVSTHVCVNVKCFLLKDMVILTSRRVPEREKSNKSKQNRPDPP